MGESLDAPVALRVSALQCFLVLSFLLFLTLGVYWQVSQHVFLSCYGDESRIVGNTHLQDGVCWNNVRWALTSTDYGVWQPLTWVTHMLDRTLFEIQPHGHHLTSLLFHVMSVLFLFLLLVRMTDTVWPSAFVAAVFAVHPMNVEAVAWLSQRGFVLGGFLVIVTLAAYVRHREKPGPGSYLIVLALFALTLTARPAMGILPLWMLLLDAWPLNRFRGTSETWRGLIVEKIPMLLLSGAACAASRMAWHLDGPIPPLGQRVANAVVSYSLYLVKFVWPDPLPGLYPEHPWVAWQVALSAAFLLAVTLIVVMRRRQNPYLLVGWLWYVIGMAPLLGIVPLDGVAMANRYAYLPMAGIAIMVAWGVPALFARKKLLEAFLVSFAFAAVWALWVDAYLQVPHWRFGGDISEYTLSVTKDNPRAHGEYGVFLVRNAKFGAAQEQLRIALRAGDYPRYEEFLKIAFKEGEMVTEVADYLREQIERDPDNIEYIESLGEILTKMSKFDEAQQQFEEVLRRDPKHTTALTNLGTIFLQRGELDTAVATFRRGLDIAPDDVGLWFRLGFALEKRGAYDEARAAFTKVLELEPDNKLAKGHIEQVDFLKKIEAITPKAP
ncbi:MAG: protein O-mannosyl-transferase [Candidatus Hydrogenedentes bacterium]|nr:protein O-mannosyl-transferase [Candidatus Hydrogenedentota bacterium]